MFGYVKVDKPECRIREYEYYRAVYCGLCLSLGKCTGQCSRMMLSYDMTFMVLVRMALEGIQPTLVPGRCVAHPFRRHAMAKPEKGSAEARVFSLCSAATVLLSYHKLKDDLADEKGLRRFRAALVLPVASILRRRAMKRYQPLDVLIREALAKLSAIEASESWSADEPAEAFGELLSHILAHELDGAKGRIAREIGFHVGKWIYLVDAADDFFEDVKRGRYNPLARLYGKTPDAEMWESLSVALTAELMEAERGFDLLDYSDGNMKAVVENIIYSGMPQTARRVLAAGGQKKGGAS